MIAALFVCCGGAMAGSVWVTEANVSPGEPVHGTFGIYQDVWAGVYNLNVSAEKGGLSTPLSAFCIEMQLAPTVAAEYDIVKDIQFAPDTDGNGAMGLDKAKHLRTLFANQYKTTMNDAYAASFQAAVWDIVYGGSVIVNLPADIGAQGTTWANAATNGPQLDYGLYALVNADHQDYVTPVPEPLTVFAVLSTMGPAGLLYRRRRRV